MEAAILECFMAKTVISSAFLRVLQAVIGLIDRLELRFHVLTSRVFIGMILHGEPAISRLQRLVVRSEEHTSELQSLMRISYAVFCLKKTKKTTNKHYTDNN